MGSDSGQGSGSRSQVAAGFPACPSVLADRSLREPANRRTGEPAKNCHGLLVKTYLNCIVIAFIAAFMLLTISSPVLAETKTFIKEYSYQASEFDSKASSRILALEQTKRLLLEELGTYLISETEVKDFQLTKDVITVLTAGIVQATILDEQWDGKIYYLKAKISADTKEVAKAIDNLRHDKRKSKELENIQKRADELEKELIKLRSELTVKADNSKVKQYSDAVNKLSATDWVQKGYSLLKGNLSAKDNKEALEAFNKALELNSDMSEIYLMRANMFYYDEGKKDFYKILADIDKSIQAAKANNSSLTVAAQRSFRAKIYKEQGDYGRAVRELEVAITLNPQDVFHPTNIDPEKEDKKAIWNKRDLDEIIKRFPKDYRGYMFRGLYYDYFTRIISEKYYKVAIAEYNKAINLNPKAPTIHYLIGSMYINIAWSRVPPEREDVYKKAIESFSKAIKFNPSFSEAYRQRAEAYLQIKEYKKAIADYDKVLEFAPDSGGVFFDRGLAHRGLYQVNDAILDFTKAIEAKNKPGSMEDAYSERGSTYHQMFEFDKAISDFDKAIELRKGIADFFSEYRKGHDIGTSNLYVKRGWTHFYGAQMKYASNADADALLSKSPELQAAISDFNMAIDFWTTNMDAYEKRAEALAAAKRYKEAIQDVEVELNFCLKNKINPGDVYRQRALIYSELGNFSQAIDDFSKAIDYNEDPAMMNLIYYQRGLTYLNLKRDQEAIKDFSETIRLSPKFTAAYINRGIAYLNARNYKMAIADFDKAIVLSPSSGDAYYYRGLTHILLLKHEEGIADYKIAARLGHKEAQDLLRKQGIEW